MPNGSIDYQMLAKLVRAKIRRDKLTLFAAARGIGGISQHTLWRITNGIGKVDSGHLFSLCEWLSVRPERLTGMAPKPLLVSAKAKNETTLDVIHALILRDKTLTVDAQSALFRIFELAYSLGTK